jgi:hypothetical protein
VGAVEEAAGFGVGVTIDGEIDGALGGCKVARI